MKQKTPKRFAIIGLPGSGKSTFAAKLGKLLGLPVHHLDRHQFLAGGKKRDKKEFLAIQRAILKEESWIIEGCSRSTFEMRFAQADTLIYFQLPRLLCIWRIFKRLFIQDKVLSDNADGCLKGVNWGILKYIWNFDKDQREEIEHLRKKYSQVDFLIFRSSKDADKYMEEFKKMDLHRFS